MKLETKNTKKIIKYTNVDQMVMSVCYTGKIA